MPSAADSDEKVTRASEARMTAHRNLANAEASAIEQLEGPRAALVRRTVEAEPGHRSAAVRQRTATALIEADQPSQACEKRARAASPEYNLLTTEEHMERWRKGWTSGLIQVSSNYAILTPGDVCRLSRRTLVTPAVVKEVIACDADGAEAASASADAGKSWSRSW